MNAETVRIALESLGSCLLSLRARLRVMRRVPAADLDPLIGEMENDLDRLHRNLRTLLEYIE